VLIESAEERTVWETNSRSDIEATARLSEKTNFTTVFLRAHDRSLSESEGINPHAFIIIVFNIRLYLRSPRHVSPNNDSSVFCELAVCSVCTTKP